MRMVKVQALAVLVAGILLLTAVPAQKAEAVDFKDVTLEPLGGAQVTLVGGTAVVSAMASEQDGVEMGLGEANAWAAAWEFPNFPEGAFVKATAVGRIEGVPNQIATTAKMVNTGSGLAFSASFAPLGSPTLTANFFLGGNLVKTIPGILNDQIAWTIPSDGEAVLIEVITFGMPDGDCEWDWEEEELPIAVQTNLGDVVVVDRVVLVEEAPLLPTGPGHLETDFFTAMQITGNVGTIVFTDVSVTPLSAVGGTVELLGQSDSPGDASESSARDYTAPIAAVAAGAIALAAAGWYARRRWLR